MRLYSPINVATSTWLTTTVALVDPVLNPYAPGAGRLPAALVGRQRELETWDIATQRVERGKGAQSMVLYGLRGVGKTVLLTTLAQAARQREWMVAKLEAQTGVSIRSRVGEAFHHALVDLARPSAPVRVLKALKTAVSFKASYDATGVWNFGVDLADAPGGGADTGVLEADLSKLLLDLAGAAGSQGVGLALLIDEAQDIDADELAALCAVVHTAHQEGLPILVVLAGLPSLPRVLAEAKSYSERLFSYHRLGPLDALAAGVALTDPAEGEGVHWEPDAVGEVVRESVGYPYFVQQFGQDVWTVAEGERITLADARVGVAHGQRALDDGFFRSRWERATRAEREYLAAMAADGDQGSLSAEVAARLGRSTQSLGPARASLIGKGLIYSPEQGRILFTVPMMASFINRQTSPEDRA